ncbi:hypothetical protein IRY61_05470 [Candidatus Saccharibacteria bacterium]|nr:hypothetical protein [Candidatus Saccharibacteria bacterium]
MQALGATVYDDTPSSEDEIIGRIRDAEVITANYIDITPNIIDQAKNLKYIIVPAVGFEWVDSAYAASKNIKVLNCPSYNSHAVAEHAIALLFAVSRRICEANTSLRNGAWQPQTLKGNEVWGKKLGLIGYGRVGKQIAKIAAGLGMSVSYVNSSSSPGDLDQLLINSDVIITCLPLNEETRQLIDQRRLMLLQPHAILINVGRGATIDQNALLRMLQEKRIKGAGLDVFDNEPLAGVPSEEIVAIANLPNVVATPHMAYNTEEAVNRLGQELIDNLKSCINNQPINVVN